MFCAVFAVLYAISYKLLKIHCEKMLQNGSERKCQQELKRDDCFVKKQEIKILRLRLKQMCLLIVNRQ